MSDTHEHRPGDGILNRYVPELGPAEREEARARLYAFVAWQLRIIKRRVCADDVDSHAERGRDTLDPAPTTV